MKDHLAACEKPSPDVGAMLLRRIEMVFEDNTKMFAGMRARPPMYGGPEARELGSWSALEIEAVLMGYEGDAREATRKAWFQAQRTLKHRAGAAPLFHHYKDDETKFVEALFDITTLARKLLREGE